MNVRERNAADQVPLTADLCIEPAPSSPRHDEDSALRERAALGHAAFAACMAALGPFEDEPFLAVAVSGGADSLALTLLADHWVRRRGGRVVGLSVDHGLRSGSRDEARRTGDWLRARNIAHRILTWRGEKPTSGVQRRARDARYALLADWCRDHHCLHLLTAHHRQDQAETVAIRKARQSGERGLAAMPLIRELPGLRLLRPLLGVDKAWLEKTLRAAGQPWLEDPSNDSPAYTRNRLRRQGLNVPALAGEAERRGVDRRDADRRAADALSRHAIIDPAGFASLHAAGFDRLSPDLARDVLTRLLMTIGGRVYPPRGQALSRLLHSMRARTGQSETTGLARTLAHCRILKRQDSWLICRERASSERLSLEPGRRLFWDDRFLISLKTERRGLAVRALGDGILHGENALLLKEKSRHLPGAVKSALPAIWKDDRLLAVPHLGVYDPSFEPACLDVRFCPFSPLAEAPFMPHISNLAHEDAVALSQR